MTSAQAEVLAAAEALVAAFGAHDTQAYFRCFSEDATFVFHNYPELIGSRSAYESIWSEWEAEGFQVLGCRSLEPRVDVITADCAVFTHRVRTQLAGEPEEQHERETMVFVRADGGNWLAVHEHLSVDPQLVDEQPVDSGDSGEQ